MLLRCNGKTVTFLNPQVNSSATRYLHFNPSNKCKITFSPLESNSSHSSFYRLFCSSSSSSSFAPIHSRRQKGDFKTLPVKVSRFNLFSLASSNLTGHRLERLMSLWVSPILHPATTITTSSVFPIVARSPSRRGCSHYQRRRSVCSQMAVDGSKQNFGFLVKKPYDPPSWALHLDPLPSHVFSLAHLPTPIHRWNIPNLPKDVELWIKRDDLSGMQLSGNKVRKLEFLMADAVAQGADCVITIGGIQSNHCRATAVAAKYLNLDCYLILRTSKVLADKDPGLTGNLLVERLVGAHVDLVTKEEYAKIGSVALTNLLKERLISEGRKPYVIPVGGSNSLGTWGYVDAVREIEQQLPIAHENVGFDDIIVACGSGGTIAGLSLGSWLSSLKAKVHAFSVCDDPDYFYDYVQDLLDGLHAGVKARDIVSIQDAKGLGYAMNTAEELKFVKEISVATGVILDPVYSGKAAFRLLKDMNENPTKWEGRKVLFIHTGGLLGLFDKTEEMLKIAGSWRQMDIAESIPRNEGIGKMF